MHLPSRPSSPVLTLLATLAVVCGFVASSALTRPSPPVTAVVAAPPSASASAPPAGGLEAAPSGPASPAPSTPTPTPTATATVAPLPVPSVYVGRVLGDERLTLAVALRPRGEAVAYVCGGGVDAWLTGRVSGSSVEVTGSGGVRLRLTRAGAGAPAATVWIGGVAMDAVVARATADTADDRTVRRLALRATGSPGATPSFTLLPKGLS